MKIVLDTNVFVAGVFFSGPPHRILQAWCGGKVQLVLSPEIFHEYSRVGEELGEQFPAVDLRPVLELCPHSLPLIVLVLPGGTTPVGELSRPDRALECSSFAPGGSGVFEPSKQV